MIDTLMPQTDFDVFAELVEPTNPSFSPEAARAILEFRFNDSAIRKINELAEKNQRGDLTDAERAIFNSYLRVGSFMNVIQAKARLSLATHGRS